jgi:hypothetical protein
VPDWLPLDYLVAVTAGDGSAEGAAAWAASALTRILHWLGAPRDAAGHPRRPDAATFSRVFGDPRHAQHADDVLCALDRHPRRDPRPGMREHLRVDSKALRGAVRGGRIPMLLSGLWDDGTTAAQLLVHGKTNEIPVFRDLLDKIPPDLKDTVISADQMHTQRKHAEKIDAGEPSSSSPSAITRRNCSTRRTRYPGGPSPETRGPSTAATAAPTPAPSRPY